MVTVTIIIPCYNQGRFLSEAIESLQAQSFADWEAIVVDDGSQDETATVVKRISVTEARLSYHRITNQGPSAARNTALKLARGEFIQYLDADDRLEREKLEIHVAYLRKNPTIDIVYGNAAYFSDGQPSRLTFGPYAQGPDDDWIASLWCAEGSMFDKLMLRNVLPVSTPLVRRQVHQRYGGWDEKFRTLEDWELWLRCASLGAIFQFIDYPYTRSLIRIHPGSATNSRREMVAGHYWLSLKAMGYARNDTQLLELFSAGIQGIPYVNSNYRLLCLLRLLLRVGARSPRLAAQCVRKSYWAWRNQC